MSRKLDPQPLTSSKFSAFGDVIETSAGETRSINEGNTVRYHDLAKLSLLANDGRPTVNIFRSTPLVSPLIIAMMERHPLSSQAFYPLGQQPYLVVVAPAGELDPAAIQCFVAQSDQGVNYHPGTWHHYSLALGEPSDFLVIDRDGPGENCDEIFLNDADQLNINLEVVNQLIADTSAYKQAGVEK